jgi:hypothetical protein
MEMLSDRFMLGKHGYRLLRDASRSSMSAAESSKDSFFNLNSTNVRDDIIQEFEDEPGAKRGS